MSTVGIIAFAGLVMIVVALPLLIFPVLAFVDCLRNRNLSIPSKIAWGCLIFFTWTLGAAIYGIVASQRPFYKTMGVICAILTIGALIAKKPLERYQEKQKADLEARKQSLKEQKSASYKTEWEHFKPIYDTFGMGAVWTSYEAGRCEEGKQILAINRPMYRQTILTKERQSSKKPLAPADLQKAADKILDVADKGYEMCVRIEESMKPEASSPPVGSRSLGDAFKNMKAAKSLGKLADIRITLAKFYEDTNGHFPAKLEDLIGKTGAVYDPSKPNEVTIMQNIPELILPEHTENHEVVIYSADVCGGTNDNNIDSLKLKDTGKWGYVADPNAKCYGTAFIDCTHVNRLSGKHWYEY